MTTANGVEVLNQTVKFIRQFVVLSDAQTVAIALWVAHTHAIDSAYITPYLNIQSAEKQCGKSLLLEVLELLVAKPWCTGRVSAAALVRQIDAIKPTLLLDESDAAFGRDKEYAEALREVLNMGHRRGGKATICIGPSTNITTKQFEVFAPKAIAGIGKLPDTVADRSLPIRLKRKAPSEGVSRFRRRHVEQEAKEIREQLVSWADSHKEVLRESSPGLPEELSARQQDGAEPLLAIADLAGTEWSTKARASLVELWTGLAAEDSSYGVQLLEDVRTIFNEKRLDRMQSTELISALTDIECSPWREWNHGKGLSTPGLAKILKPYEIMPRTVRFQTVTAKGYQREQFEDAWSRYLRQVSSQVSQTNENTGETQITNPPTWNELEGVKVDESTVNTRVVTDVTAQGVIPNTKTGFAVEVEL